MAEKTINLQKLIQDKINSITRQRIIDSTISILRERRDILNNEKKADEEAGFQRIAWEKDSIVYKIDDAIEILEDTSMDREIEIEPNKKILQLITEALKIAIKTYSQ